MSHSLVFMDNRPEDSNSGRNRRRSQRVMLSLPVIVCGEGPEGPFREETRTVVVNAHGALLSLLTKVSHQQILRLNTPGNSENQACRVTYVGPTTEGRTQFAVEFTRAAPQ